MHVVMISCEGQVIKEVVDAERRGCVFPGDVLVAINDVTVRHWPHDDVVNLLRRCRARRVARLTLMTSRRGVDPPPAPVRRAAAVPPRPLTAMASPVSADPLQRVDYNQLYRRIYSPVPFVRVGTPETTQTRSPEMRRDVTSNGKSDVVMRYSAPPTSGIVGGSPTPRRLGPEQRREPRRSLPAPYVDLLSPLAQRRMSRQSSQNSLNFSGTPDFIPASAYIEDDDRRRRATGRPSADHELAALTLDDPSWPRTDDVFSATTNTQLPSVQRDDSVHSYDTDEASLPSSGSSRNVPAAAGLPVTSPATHDRRPPAAFIGAGSETCNGYNTRTEALHSAASARRAEHRHRSQSALGDAVVPGGGTHRGPEPRLSTDGDYDRPAATSAAAIKNGSLDRRDTKGLPVPPSRVAELTEPVPHTSPALSVSSSPDVFLRISTVYCNHCYESSKYHLNTVAIKQNEFDVRSQEQHLPCSNTISSWTWRPSKDHWFIG